MNKIQKLNYIVYTFIFGIFTILTFMLDFTPAKLNHSPAVPNFERFFLDITSSLKRIDILFVGLMIFTLYFYYSVYFKEKKDKKKTIFCIVLSIIFSTITLISKSYLIDDTLTNLYITSAQIVKTFIMFFGHYFMYYAIIKKLINIELNSINFKKKTTFIEKQLNKRPALTAIVIIFLLWLPVIIIAMPGISTGDTLDELAQFFHLDSSWSVESINLINEDIYINMHHPVLHTVTMGAIFLIGKKISSLTLGAIIYTILQVIFLLFMYSFFIKYMKKIKIPNLIIFLSILFFGLNPLVVTNALCAVKDTPNAAFNILYCIFLLQIIRNYNSIFNSKKRIVFFLITILMVLLLRNNGIYTYLLSFPFLFLLYKNKWKKLLIVFLIPIFIFGGINKVLLPSLDITKGSPREMMSVPFMQLARTAKYHTKDFSKEDIETINKVLNFDLMIYFYDPDCADGVKGLYNKGTTKEQLIDFYKVWFKYLKKHPGTYINSFMNSTYNYFYPAFDRSNLTLLMFNFKRLPELDVNPYEQLEVPRKSYNYLLSIYHNLPIITNKVAYYTWLLLLSCIYIISKKKYKYLIPLTPLLAILLSCLASPLNGCFRYMFPIILFTPFIISIDYLVYKENKKEKTINS